jgi:hypothetical protein
MNIPTISLDQIPGLEGAAALFGAMTESPGSNDDRIVDIMVFLYEVFPPLGLL